MKLNDDQKQKVAAWIEAGAKLSEIQKRLEAELGLRMTYLEARLLVDDLKLIPKNIEPPKAPAEVTPAAAPAAEASLLATAPAPAAAPAAAPPGLGGKVSVTLDQLTRPGALVSGGVTFSDGQKATWYLDEMGRLGLVPGQPGYKPTPEDVQAFQRALQAEMQKLGY